MPVIGPARRVYSPPKAVRVFDPPAIPSRVMTATGEALARLNELLAQRDELAGEAVAVPRPVGP